MFLRLSICFQFKIDRQFLDLFSVQTINSVTSSRLLKYSSSSIRVPLESKNRWSLSAFIISLARWNGRFMFFTAMRILSIWFSSQKFNQKNKTYVQKQLYKFSLLLHRRRRLRVCLRDIIRYTFPNRMILQISHGLFSTLPGTKKVLFKWTKP